MNIGEQQLRLRFEMEARTMRLWHRFQARFVSAGRAGRPGKRRSTRISVAQRKVVIREELDHDRLTRCYLDASTVSYCDVQRLTSAQLTLAPGCGSCPPSSSQPP